MDSEDVNERKAFMNSQTLLRSILVAKLKVEAFKFQLFVMEADWKCGDF